MIDGPFFEMLSVQDNIYLLEHFAGVTLDLDYYHELIEYFEIASLVHMPVISLSTGQRERVNYVRALVHRPSVVILDEPGANLDAHLFAKLLSHLEQSSRE